MTTWPTAFWYDEADEADAPTGPTLARHRFGIGQAVRMTPRARRLFPRHTQVGVVEAYGRNPAEVRVRRVGCAKSDVWLASFWEPVLDDTSAP